MSEIDTSEIDHLQALPQDGLHTRRVQRDDIPYGVASFFAEQTITSKNLTVLLQTPCSPCTSSLYERRPKFGE